MDLDILKIGGLSSGFTFGIFIVYKIFHWLNNKRIHSSCNGHNLDVELQTIKIDKPPETT